MAQKLADVLAKLGGGLGQTLSNCNLVSLWSEVVDDRVGKHTEAVKIKYQTLYVKTSSPTWAQELSFLKPKIITKFNRHLV